MNKEHVSALAILAAFFVAIAGITLLSGCNVEHEEPLLSNDYLPGGARNCLWFSPGTAL